MSGQTKPLLLRFVVFILKLQLYYQQEQQYLMDILKQLNTETKLRSIILRMRNHYLLILQNTK